MKFLLDENTSRNLAKFLIDLGHKVFRIKEISPGIEDFEVLELAKTKEAVLITLDKDFGELVFNAGKQHSGIILIRLPFDISNNSVKAVDFLLSKHSESQIADGFVVITQKEDKFQIRIKNKSRR